MNKYTCKELIAICKEMEIKKYSGKKKQELIWLITPDNVLQIKGDVQEKNIIKSKGSVIAKNGIRAEKQICLQENIKDLLAKYFKTPIESLQCVARKKYDILITFTDGSTTTIQNKDGGGGRGWSVDRRSVLKYENEQIITILNTLCLKTGCDKPVITKTVASSAIFRCLLGDLVDEQPKYFTHTISNKISGEITSIEICKTESLMDFIKNEQYVEAIPKKTCLHLSPSIYLQRKGGGKTDSRPNDIQMKFKLTYNLKCIFQMLENHNSIAGTNDNGTFTTMLLPR